jgi:hypothetical protein
MMRPLPTGADQISDPTGMTAGIDHGGDHRTMLFHEIVDGQMAAGNKGATIVVKFQREYIGVVFDPVGGRKLLLQEFVATGGTARGKIIIRHLHIFAHCVEGDDGESFHFCRRIDRFSSAIVTVDISPLA